MRKWTLCLGVGLMLGAAALYAGCSAGAPRQSFAIGRGVLAQTVERRRVPHCVFQPGGVTRDLDGQHVRNGSPRSLRRLIVGAKETKEIKSLGDRPIAQDDRASNQRDNKT